MPTLPYEGFFSAMGNIAAVLGGFTALVSVFRHDAGHRWTAPEIFGVRFMFEHMFAAVALSLLLQPLLVLCRREGLLWWWASAILAVFLFLETIANAKRVMALRRARDRPRHLKGLLFIYFPVNLAFMGLQVVNLLEGHPSAPMWGSLWIVANIGIQLSHFLFPSDAPSTPADTP